MRLGDLDALMHHFMDKPPDYYHTSYIVGEINAAPTIDAVPVVHCKDCKHCVSNSYPGYFYCDAWGMDLNKDEYPPNTFFCADGERVKTNAD